MGDPATYEGWKCAATAADRASGAERWKDEDETDLYDYRVIRRRYEELVKVRASGSAERLLYYLDEGLHGNMGGMGSRGLYRQSQFGTKTLIVDYVHEVVAALEQVEAFDKATLRPAEKLAYFRRAAECFGRSALMLSGAGSLGPFHVGVVRALADQDLLPHVISGASAGSFVAALVCTTHHEEIAKLSGTKEFVDSVASAGGHEPGTTARPGRQITLDDLNGMLEASIPDMTFAEAFEETGRHLNISVAPAETHQRSRMLNSATAPNVLIREAVLASCAIPGIFPPVQLVAKNAAGTRQAYVESRLWVDGSITDDLPAGRLARQYGVNHFISSQTNPVALWSLPRANEDALSARFTGIYQSAARQWLRAIYPFAMDQVRNLGSFNTMTRLWFSVMTQEYAADINIMPRQRNFDPTRLLSILTEEQTIELVRGGELATWPKIEMIRICTAIGRCIDSTLRRLESQYLRA